MTDILERLRHARQVAVHGHGREGRAALDALPSLAPDAILTIVDDATLPDQVVDELGRRDVVVAHGSPTSVEAGLTDVDVVVRSPGVPLRTPALRAARAAGVTITSGTTLWFAMHRPDNVIAVTGTKGKSTTVSLLAHLLRRAGRDAITAGNIGQPLLALGDPPSVHDHVVVELSSYQLADLEARLPVGVFLNLLAEHVDWHGDHATYRDDKSRIIGLSDVIVANAADERIAARTADHPDRRLFDARTSLVSLGHTSIEGDVLDDALDGSALIGAHHRHNLAAALAAAATVGLDPEAALVGLADYTPLPHRLQLVADDGRRWVDDSISTIPESAVAALGAFPGDPVTLLVGGYEREQDHAVLVDALRARGDVTVLAMPTTGHRLAQEQQGSGLDVRPVDDLGAAVATARELTPHGGVILLSPAAPSYGAFTNFEERGDTFARLATDPDAPGR